MDSSQKAATPQKKKIKIVDKTRVPQLHVKDLPFDLYDRIKRYVESNNKNRKSEEIDGQQPEEIVEWDEALPLASKHFFFIDGAHAALGKGYILTFETWEYKCPIPSYSDLNLVKYVEPVGEKIKIVNRNSAK